MTLLYFRDKMNLTNITTSDYVLTSLHSDEHVSMVAINEHSLLLTRFIVQKLCVPFVVLVGVIGNLLCIIVLTRKCMKSSTNSYLTALSVFDVLYLSFTFVLSLKHHHFFQYWSPYVHLFPFARVLTDMFGNVSVILTVTFTLERYIGVCHPIKGRTLCTTQRAKSVILVVSSVAILCTTPEFWEMEVTLVTIDNQTLPVAVYTIFADRPSYAVGYYWFLVVVFTILPLLLLCLFNGILIVTVLKAARIRRELTLLTHVSVSSKSCRSIDTQPARLSYSTLRDQHNITKMLITVVIVFIVCQLPGAMLLLYKTFVTLENVHECRERDNRLKIAGNVTNLLVQINASTNFLLYSVISTKFRRVFYRTIFLGEWKCLSQDQRKTAFSRSDGVQMSFLSGHKLTCRTQPWSTNTLKLRCSQRSSADKFPGQSLNNSCGRQSSRYCADGEEERTEHLLTQVQRSDEIK